MKINILWLTLVALVVTPLSVVSADDTMLTYKGGDGPGKGKHIVMISGDEEYRSEEALPMLAGILSKHHGFDCTVLFSINPEDGTVDPNNQKNIPGIDKLKSADLCIIMTRFRNLPDADMQVIDDYLKAGKPIIGIRTATHAFNIPKDAKFHAYSFNNKGGFGKQVLGETWISHHGQHKGESTRGVINEAAKDNPILRGVDDVWGPTDVYGVRNLPEDATVLVYGSVLKGMKPEDKPVEGKKNDPMMPIVWTMPYQLEGGKQGTSVCSTFGSAIDYLNEDGRRIIVNAAFDLVGLEDKITPDLDVSIVGEYDPSFYGFNSFKKGLKPADFQGK
ncbi:hypothetical protein C5Y96_00805 [Blastopirellula marina]|uniref:Uncharacterized protein n=1 Tax=Blastopirellula marina TaxID=124 RepID=A0A2S8GA69_9BACT|nr:MULTISPECIES: ThuA domain-containing protein [Pirellulaceae]PQO41309.1 hypothetical protein C5Y96_00805 [Blastopirellula marina]RCS56333.1 hypothetical protein DTL36_00805 [Bremerella cremea]